VGDQAAEYAAAWAAFERLERTAPHRQDWARWSAGHTVHRLFAVLVDELAARGAVACVQRALVDLHDLEVHPAHFLHVSLQSLGFDRQLDIDLGAVAAAVADQPAFELCLGAPNAFQSAVFLEVHSQGRLLALRTALRNVGGPALGRLDPYPGLLFHLTLGYFGPRLGTDQLRARLRPLRDGRCVRARVDEVGLFEVPTDQRQAYPLLAPVSRFRLGPPAR
jgi:RNA 2',3'-cyclic 3'-phosphodiesterase